MAEHQYQPRGPENRTSLITVRVTAEHRELLHRLASERGETVSRMLLAPWLRHERRTKQKRSSVRREPGGRASGSPKDPVRTVDVMPEPGADAGSSATAIQQRTATRRRSKLTRPEPAQEALVLFELES